MDSRKDSLDASHAKSDIVIHVTKMSRNVKSVEFHISYTITTALLSAHLKDGSETTLELNVRNAQLNARVAFLRMCVNHANSVLF